MPTTTIIIDDEALARQRIRGFLKSHPDTTILTEASNGESGLKAILKHQPDLIFLDIQMPEMDGFAMLNALPAENRPKIIFTTAYDEFAIKAFDVHALDYLLKPFSKSRFDEALARSTTLPPSASSDLSGKIDTLLASIPRPPITRLCIKDQGRMTFVSLRDILWIESAGNYAEIHDSQRTHLMRETMTKLEKQLPANDFIRVSRSAILRVDAITEVRSDAKGDHYVTLTSGAKIKSTITLKELQTKLEQS